LKENKNLRERLKQLEKYYKDIISTIELAKKNAEEKLFSVKTSLESSLFKLKTDN